MDTFLPLRWPMYGKYTMELIIEMEKKKSGREREGHDGEAGSDQGKEGEIEGGGGGGEEEEGEG